jgi:hypothetical protein
MTRPASIVVIGVLACGFTTLGAQVADPPHIIARSLQQLQMAADRGYRIVPLADSRMGLLLVKAPAGATPVEYLMVSTSRTRTFEEELNGASASGYRFVRLVGGLDAVVERPKVSTTTRTHEYLVLATDLLQTMEDELRGPAAVGFQVVGQARARTPVRKREEEIAVLERPLSEALRTRTEYLLLDTVTVSTLERELRQAAARGYRMTPMQGGWGNTALLGKPIGDVDAVVEYRVLSTLRSRTMQKEMDEMSAEGYHFAAVLDTAVVMEREKGVTSRTHEPRIWRWSRMGNPVLVMKSAGAERELLADLANGFRLVGQAMFTSPVPLFGDESFVILERRVEPGPSR